MNELITLVMVMSGWIVGMFAVPALAVVISAIVWHLLPSCAYSKWVSNEVLQTEPLSHTPSDWLSKRMNK